MAESILKLPAVKQRTALSGSSIYAAAKEGNFPSPIKIGPRSSGWVESEVDEWIQDQINKSRSDS